MSCRACKYAVEPNIMDCHYPVRRLCQNMKRNTLMKIRDALKYPQPEQVITLEEDLSKRAARCIERMFELAA